MNEALSEGQGVCRCESVMTFTVDREALRMGAGPAAMNGVLSEIHRLNRHRDDRVAVSLPEHDGSNGFAGIGTIVRAYGSSEAMAALAAQLSASRTGKLVIVSGIDPVTAIPGEEGTSFYRSRRGEKGSKAGRERARARIERRGGTWVDRPHLGQRPEKGLGFFHSGSVRVFFGSRPGTFSGTVSVNTYGLVPAGSQEALPERSALTI